MASIAEARAYLQGVKARLEKPVSFYAAHQAAWKELARTVAQTTLLRVKPDHVPAESWNQAVEAALETITAELLDQNGLCGVQLWMLRQIEPSKPGVTPYAAPLDYEVIVDWVAAGRAGEEGGKRLREGPGEVDADKSDREIAWRVFHAIRLNKNPRLLEAISAWAAVAGDPQVLQAMDAVQVAWDEVFQVQASEDWERWVGETIRE